MTTTVRSGTRIAWWLRAWLVVEIGFGVIALLALGPYPEQSGTRFAWPIEPVVTAAVLAGLYACVAPLFVLAACARRWESIRVLVPAVIAFTTAELLATLIHLDKFSVGTFPFWLWLASYALPPPIFTAAYVVHQRRARATAVDPDPAPLPRALRVLLLVIGTVFVLEAVLSFAVPALLIGSFPWMLTPLTARVLCGWLLAVGLILLAVVRENDRDRVRLASPLLVMLLPVLAIQVARYRGDVDLSHPRLWINVVVLGVLLGCGLYLAAPRASAGQVSATTA